MNGLLNDPEGGKAAGEAVLRGTWKGTVAVMYTVDLISWKNPDPECRTSVLHIPNAASTRVRTKAVGYADSRSLCVNLIAFWRLTTNSTPRQKLVSSGTVSVANSLLRAVASAARAHTVVQ